MKNDFFSKSNRIISLVLSITLIVSCLIFCSPFKVSADDSVSKDVYDSAKDRILDAASRFEPTVDISDLNIPKSYGRELYFDTILSNPQSLALSTYFSSSDIISDDDITISQLKLSYIKSQYNLAGREKAMENFAESFSENYISSGMSDVEKFLSIFEFLCANVTNSYDNAFVSVFNSTAYGPLIDGKGDSLGYALAFKFLSDNLGLQSIIVFGKENSNIYWNAVNINGAWYYVDVFGADGDNKKFIADGVETRVNTVEHLLFMSDESSFAVLGHQEGTNYGYGDPIRVRGSHPAPFSFFWTGITSPMAYYDGDWYCISNLADNVILKRSADENYVGVNETPFYTNSEAVGSIASDDSFIYFTTLDAEIHTLDADANSNLVYDAYGFNRKVSNIYNNGTNIECEIFTDTGVQESGKEFLDGNVAPVKTVTYGDLNGDKVINNADYEIICEYIKNDIDIDSTYFDYADVDQNGVVDVFDRVYIARYLSGDSLIASLFFS